MTKEQWLVYLWSIYPQGGFSVILWISILLTVLATFIIFMLSINGIDRGRKDTLWHTTKKLRYFMYFIELICVILVNLTPTREHFLYIIATPYVVDSGKSIVESLNDETSKLYKINKFTDKALDKAFIAIDNVLDENNKEIKEKIK